MMDMAYAFLWLYTRNVVISFAIHPNKYVHGYVRRIVKFTCNRKIFASVHNLLRVKFYDNT